MPQPITLARSCKTLDFCPNCPQKCVLLLCEWLQANVYEFVPRLL